MTGGNYDDNWKMIQRIRKMSQQTEKFCDEVFMLYFSDSFLNSIISFYKRKDFVANRP